MLSMPGRSFRKVNCSEVESCCPRCGHGAWSTAARLLAACGVSLARQAWQMLTKRHLPEPPSIPSTCTLSCPAQVLTLLSQAQRDQQQKEHVEKLKAKQRAAAHKVGIGKARAVLFGAACGAAGWLWCSWLWLQKSAVLKQLSTSKTLPASLPPPRHAAGASSAALWPLRAPDAAGRYAEAAGCGSSRCAGGLQAHRPRSRRRAAAAATAAAGRGAAPAATAAAQQPARRGGGSGSGAAARQPQRAAPAAGGGARGAGAAAAAPRHPHCHGAARHDCAAQHAQHPLVPGEGRVPDDRGGQGGCWGRDRAVRGMAAAVGGGGSSCSLLVWEGGMEASACRLLRHACAMRPASCTREPRPES